MNTRLFERLVESIEPLAERGLDFADARQVFDGVTFELEDTQALRRETHDLLRLSRISHGMWSCMSRKANDREKARIAPLLEI